MTEQSHRYQVKDTLEMILTLVRMDKDRWIVIKDEGYIDSLQKKPLRPASTRIGETIFGPCAKSVAEKYVVSQNRLREGYGV